MNNTTIKITRGITFVFLLALGGAFFSDSIVSLFTVSSNRELYSHIPLIPFVSLYFLFMYRERIFSEVRWDCVRGLLILSAAFVLYGLKDSIQGTTNEHNYLSFMMAGVFLWILGSFLFVCGGSAFRRAAFPLLFLLFVIPIPTAILDPFVRFLQRGSAEFSHAIFKLTGVPLHRDGMLFFLPGLTVEVAEQCSGIRSSIALFITGILAGKLFLEKGWARLVLVLCVFPITMFKNALRIVMLSLLGAYVDPRFITGSWLHSSGGIPFFAVALLFFLPVLWGIRRWEKSTKLKGEG